MNTFELLMQGMVICLQPANLFFCFAGGILGVIVGALPGLGSVAGTALLLPLTYTMNPTAAIIMLAAIYYGNMFGGAISAILINIPGDAPAVMTAIDGYKMTQKGRAGQALFTAFISSGIGGMIGAIILTALGTTLTTLGLKFGPPETAMLILVAMTSIGWILGDSPSKGIAATGLGIFLACMGLDAQTGENRFTFGLLYLLGGIPFIPTIIGFFGFSQVIRAMVEGIHNVASVDVGRVTLRGSIPEKEDWKRILPAAGHGSILGFIVGLLPGSGATTAAFLSYIIEKRINRRKEEMGTGAPQGVAISESANNSASIGAFGPLLSLGIPGSGTAAVLLGGLMMWGLQPGPLFMANNPEFCWSLIASMFVGDIIICLVVILAIPVLVKILRIPNTILVPIILCISIMGAYCVNNNEKDILVMILAGLIGYIFLKFALPMAPIALALVLTATLESAIRQSFTISNGNPMIFFSRPLSLGLFVVGAVFILMPIFLAMANKFKKK